MRVLIMIGAPGAGKSTVTESLKKRYLESEVAIFSSDKIRESMKDRYDGDRKKINNAVFEQLHTKLFVAIEGKKYKVIVYDAMNLSRRRRRVLYNEIKKIDGTVQVEAVVAMKTLGELHDVNMQRDMKTSVPALVVSDKYANLQVPRMGVDCDRMYCTGDYWFKKGFDVYNAESVQDVIDAMNPQLKLEVSAVLGMEHNCPPYHMETVDEHINMFFDHPVIQSFPTAKAVALFHDLGKAVTKKIGQNGRATYRGHANVSAMYFLNYMYGSDCYECKEDEQRILEYLNILETIHQHMNAHQKGGLGAKNIRNNKLGDIKMFIDLFAKIDKESRLVLKLEKEKGDNIVDQSISE